MKTVKRSDTRRAYPDKQWHESLQYLMDNLLPKVHNILLHESNKVYEATGKHMSKFDLINYVGELRKEIPELMNWNREIFSNVAKRIAKARDAHEKGIRGKPRFKGKHRSVDSITLNEQSNGFKLWRSGKKSSYDKKPSYGKYWGIHVKGLDFCKFKGKPPEGKIKNVTIKRTAKRIVFIFACEVEIPEKKKSKKPVVGIDVGVNNMITLSTGEQVKGRERDTKRIKTLQRKLSNQVEGSNSWKKTKKSLAKEWQTKAESDKGQMHRLTRHLVDNHGPNFAIENKVASNLRKKKKGNKELRRKISEQCWGQFGDMLTYKAEEAGGLVDRVAAA